jgi:hypothetical protein
MLKAIPVNFLSWDFRVLDGDREVAAMDLSLWREKGTLAVEGLPYRVTREGLARGAFVLEDGAGRVLAKAEKPNALRRSFVVEHGGRRFRLEAWTPFGRAFVLRDDRDVIGTIKPLSFLTRRTSARLPEDLPLAVRVFMLWLVFVLWRRDASVDAGGGAAPAA